MMRAHTVLPVLLASFYVYAAYAQTAVVTADQFRAATPDQRKQALYAIVVHESSASDSQRIEIIRLALSDPALREGALAAVVSRAAAPVLGPAPNGREEFKRQWLADLSNLQLLRPAIEGALRDLDERVRDRAVAALTSLDFDQNTLNIRVSPRTQKLLVDLYYSESSSVVRRRIVAGFAAEAREPSPEVRQLLLRAFSDPDAGIRGAATHAAERFSPDVAMPLLIARLSDESREVRLQTVIVLMKIGERARPLLEDMRTRLTVEMDPQVRELLASAVKTLSRAD
jgi:HEAT repeat protein